MKAYFAVQFICQLSLHAALLIIWVCTKLKVF